MSEKLKVIFVGIPDMALVCLENLLRHNVNIVSVVPPKKTHETYSFFKQFVLDKGLNFINFESSPNDPDCIRQLKELNADIGVVASYNSKFSLEFLNTTKMGYINSHPSLLPNYRGACPYFHIINNGEKESGITLHLMDENFDTGNIVYQEKFEVLPNETMGTIFNRTTYMISDAMIRVLSEIEKNGCVKSKPQPKLDSYIDAYKVDGNFRIRWNTNSVFEIERLIRACNPFYNAITSFRDTSLRIVSAIAIEKKHDFKYGQIIDSNDEYVFVAGKNGLLALNVVQIGTWGCFGARDFCSIFNPRNDEFLI